MDVVELYNCLFNPEGVAVIGASPKEGKMGRVVIENMVRAEFKGKIYPVNPKYEKILGLKTYKNVVEVPDPVDTAIIIIPAISVPKVIEDCGKRGIRVAIVLSAGFSEAGRKDLELELLRNARKYGIRIIGPNCAGVIIPSIGFHGSFESLMSAGRIAVIGQSGAYLTAMAAELERRGLGISAFISYGNRVDLDEEILLRLLLMHEETKAIAFYVEGLRKGIGSKLLKTIREVTKEKPLVIHKAGITSAGARAVISHTGSLAGEYKIYEAAFRQSGAIIVNDIDLILDVSEALSILPLPHPNSIPIVLTNSGGHGVTIADHLELLGVKVPETPESVREILKKLLPPHAALNNPIDLLAEASAEIYAKSVEVLLANEKVGVIVIVINPPPLVKAIDVCKAIIDVWDQSGRSKPLVFFLAGFGIEDSMKYLRSVKAPVVTTHRGAAYVVKTLYDRSRYLREVVE